MFFFFVRPFHEGKDLQRIKELQAQILLSPLDSQLFSLCMSLTYMMIYPPVRSLDSLILPCGGPWGKLSHLPTISLHVEPNKTVLWRKYHYFYKLTHLTTQ